jgi:hypothetical protein
MVSRISVRVESWKISGARRFVIMRVFDGGEGSISGGRLERSRESGDRLLDDVRECCGDGRVACMFAIMDVDYRDDLSVV